MGEKSHTFNALFGWFNSLDELAANLRTYAMSSGGSKTQQEISAYQLDEWADGAPLSSDDAIFLSVFCALKGLSYICFKETGEGGKVIKKKRRRGKVRRDVHPLLDYETRLAKSALPRYIDNTGRSLAQGYYQEGDGLALHVKMTLFGPMAEDLKGRDFIPPSDRFDMYSPKLHRVDDPRGLGLKKNKTNENRIRTHYLESARLLGSHPPKGAINTLIREWRSSGFRKSV